jgi:hypothetical protein
MIYWGAPALNFMSCDDGNVNETLPNEPCKHGNERGIQFIAFLHSNVSNHACFRQDIQRHDHNSKCLGV